MNNIKNLISLAYKNTSDSEKLLCEALGLLNGIVSQKNINECFEQATDLCVILGECCLKNNIKNIAYDSLQLYFSLDPQENQYLARAYLLQAQLICPQRFDDECALDKPIGFVLKAINFSKKDKSFYYLVYNSSLVYYEVVRNYLRANYYQYLCKSLNKVCKSLEEVNDPNMSWRSQLMLLLIQCHIDAGHKKEVSQITDSTVQFISKHSPHLLRDLLICFINNGIGTMDKYIWYTRNHPAMQMFIKLCKLKMVKDKDSDSSSATEAKRILSSLIGLEEVSATGTSENVIAKPDAKSAQSNSFNTKKLTNDERCMLLLELAKICLQKSFCDVCQQCINKVQQMATEDMLSVIQESEFVRAELVMLDRDTVNERITASNLKLRLTNIEKCKSTLMEVIRTGNNKLIELGCATLWNLCLPILQPNIVTKIVTYLVLVADSLESIGCLNYKFCAQVHIEVGKGYVLLEQSNEAIRYFKQAILLDRTGEYSEFLEHYIYKLKMQEKLYEKPTDSCDFARQVLEQVKTTLLNEKISLEKLRPLLAQIGHCLAPDDFLVLLDHDLSIEGSGTDKNIHGKFVKTTSWENMVTRIESYLQRSGNTNDRVKGSLWMDLVKLSRKVQLWDICRVASCFAILYDDDRWKNFFQNKIDSSSKKGSKGIGSNSNSQTTENSTVLDVPVSDIESTEISNGDNKGKKREESDISIGCVKRSRFEKTLLEQLVDVYFIRAEAFIQALRNEGAQLFTFPERPKDFKKHPKGFVKDTTIEDTEWKEYCGCLERLSNLIVNCFLRSAAISVDLQQPWFTQNAATYLWNYSIHVINLSDHGILVSNFQMMYDYLRQMMTDDMIEVIVQYGIVLAHGIIQKLIPMSLFTLDNVFEIPIVLVGNDKKGKKEKETPKQKATASTGSGQVGQVDAVTYFKKALEICQFLMDITSDSSSLQTETQSTSSNNNKVALLSRTIDIKTKSLLIEIWVQCKQLLQQNIGRTLGTDDLESKTGQRSNVRAITAVQMLWICQNEFYKFPELPTIDECLILINSCEWPVSTVLLGLLAKLCQVVMKGLGPNMTDIFMKINGKVEKFCPDIKTYVSRTVNEGSKDTQSEEKSAASFIIFCLGISLHKTSQNTTVLMQSLKFLVKACCLSRDANDYFLVSQISHYFWKIAQCLIERFSSINHIVTDIEIILNCMSQTVNRRRLKLLFEPHTEEEELKIEAELEEKLPHDLQISNDQKMINVNQNKSLFLTKYRPQMTKLCLEQDLKLRIQMYVAVFQSYILEEKWTKGLKTLDDAISELPRSNHKLELFRHKLLTKVRLGQCIDLDIHKFKNQKEDEIALLWREIAITSGTLDFQLMAYKNSIEVLKNKNYDWIKSDLIMEFSQWMFHHDYPLAICCQYVDFAIDVLLNIEIIKERTHPPSVKSKSRSASRKLGSSIKSSAKSDGVTKVVPVEELTQNDVVIKDSDVVSASIGCQLQKSRPLSIKEIEDIRLLSSLFICFTMKSKLLTSSLENCSENVFMAQACVIQMWQVAMKNVAGAIKEFTKWKMENESLTKPKEKKDTKEKISKPDQESAKSKIVKRKGPVDWLPETYEDWSAFEVSENVLEVLKSPLHMENTGFHDNTIKSMGMFMNCCDTLVTLLTELGHELFAFPVLSLMDAISRTDDTLPAKSLNQYIHLRFLELSLHLNMQETVSHHHKFIEYPFITPEYDAHVAVIESNIAEYRKQNELTNFPINFVHQSTVSLEVSHLIRKQTKFGYLHELWIKMGWRLIELGYNQEVSEVVCAAENLSNMMKDQEMIADCKLLKAKLFTNQGELQKALEYIDDFENNHSHFSIKQWSIVTDLLIEIGMDNNQSNKTIHKIYIRLLRLKNHTEKRINEMKLSNQKILTENLISRMNYGLVLFDKKIHIMDLGENISWNNSSEPLQNYLARLNDVELIYQKNKSFECLIEIFREKISIFDLLIKLGDESTSKFLLQKKLFTIEHFHSFLQIKFDNIHQVCPLPQESSFSLQVDRQLCRVKLIWVDCLLEIYAIHVRKLTTQYLEHRKKDPLKQIVDEYVAEEISDGDSVEWKQLITGLCDKICCHLSDIHTICSTIPEIGTQHLARYGHVLKLRAMEICPTDNVQWCQQRTDTQDSRPVRETDQSNLEINETETSPKTEEILNDNSIKMHGKFVKATKRKNAMLQSREYLSQAVELINQSISMSINYQFYENCCYAIELLLDILGQFETQLSVQLLCLYQNCCTSISMRHILLVTLRQASMGQFAALLQQHNYLTRQTHFYESNLTASPLYRSVVERLNSTFLAWKMTNVTFHQAELLKDISSLANGIFILQHSVNNDTLYGAFIDLKQKISSTAKVPSKPPNSDRTRICRIRSSPEKIFEMKNKWLEFKTDLESLVYRIENKNELFESQAAQYLEIENEAEIIKINMNKDQFKTLVEMEVNRTEKKYLELIRDLQEYLNPIFLQLDNPIFNDPEKELNVQKSSPQTNDSMIILVDDILAFTSLESIPSARSILCRDFSLQTLYHRIKGFGVVDQSESVLNADSSKKKEKSKIPHRIVALRETNKKPAKTATLSHQIPTGMTGIDIFQLRYIIDPLSDSISASNSLLLESFKKELIGTSNSREQITSRWIGLIGERDFPSMAEIELYLKDATTIIYMNTEDMVSFLTPQKIATLNTSELQLLCCFDRMKNRKSKQRVMKKISLMNFQDIDNLNSVATVKLMTLMGTKSLVCNQWTNLTDWSTGYLSIFLSSFVDEGLSVGESVQQIRNISQDNKSDINRDSCTFTSSATFIKSNPVVYGLPNLVASS